MKQSKQSKIRTKLIDSFETQKARRITALQRAFALSVSSYLFSELDTKSDALKTTARNFSVLAQMGALRKAFYADNVLDFLRWNARSANKLFIANEKYFTGAPKGLIAKSKNKMRNKLGVGSGGDIRPGGFLSIIGDINRPFTDIQALATKTVSGGAPIKALKQAVNIYTGAKTLEKDMSEKAVDLFPVLDRDIGNDFRLGMGLGHAIYQGGIIKTSRPFCVERNDKVYTVEEISSWSLLDFEGKSNPYDPFTDCGGYNCRHQLDWISNELAVALRPDLDKKALR